MITLTESAQSQVSQLLEKRGTPDAFLRLGVKTAGCSGLTYKMEYAEGPDIGDEIVECGTVKVIVDAKAIIYLIGTEVDFQVEQLKSGFVFNNPNQKDTCGCGESFTV